MLSITAVFGAYQFRHCIRLSAQGGSPINTSREDFAGSSAVLLRVIESLDIEFSDFEAEDVTMNGDYFSQVVEIVIEGVPTILEARCMCLSRSLRRLLL
jgi:hypothetical protein